MKNLCQSESDQHKIITTNLYYCNDHVRQKTECNKIYTLNNDDIIKFYIKRFVFS